MNNSIKNATFDQSLAENKSNNRQKTIIKALIFIFSLFIPKISSG